MSHSAGQQVRILTPIHLASNPTALLLLPCCIFKNFPYWKIFLNASAFFWLGTTVYRFSWPTESSHLCNVIWTMSLSADWKLGRLMFMRQEVKPRNSDHRHEWNHNYCFFYKILMEVNENEDKKAHPSLYINK